MKQVVVTALLAGIVVVPLLSQDNKPAGPLTVTIETDKAEYTLGDDVQVEVTVKNTGAQALELNELVFDQRSVEFDITLGNNQKFTYSRLLGGAVPNARLPLEKIKLAPGKELRSAFKIPTLLVNDMKIQARVTPLTGSAAVSEEKKVTVKPAKGAKGDETRLAATVTFQIGKEQHTILINLEPEAAPSSVAHFVSLAKKGFYKDLKVFRVIRNAWFQTGCPYNDGFGGPGYAHKSEHEMQSTKEFDEGTVALSQADKNGWQGSQFFISLGRLAYLKQKFTIIGKVDLELQGPKTGKDIIRSIPKESDPDRNTDKPRKPVTITNVEIVTK